MTFCTKALWAEIDDIISRRDLLCHPFYQAWSAGELTGQDLRAYAAEYYHHVAAFPTYLSRLHARLAPGALRTAVAANLADEEYPRPHSELWLDFLRGMGGSRADVLSPELPEMQGLVDSFSRMSQQGTIAAALASYYVYESQVPRIAKEKARGLREMYGADEETCGYFTLHQTADVHHSQVWREQLGLRLAEHPEETPAAIAAAAEAAEGLWRALDGMERARQERLATAN